MSRHLAAQALLALIFTFAACNGDKVDNNKADTGQCSDCEDTATPDMSVTVDMDGTPNNVTPDTGPDADADMGGDDDTGLMCADGEILCLGACATCPASDNVESFVCNMAVCEIGSCVADFEPCDSGCCIAGVPAASGRVSSENFTALDTSIGLDSNGYPRIVYRNANNTNIEYAAWDGQQWATTIVEVGGDPYVTNIEVGADDVAHLTWWDVTGDLLRHAWQTAAGWQVETVAADINGYHTLALDSMNRPHVVYQDTLTTTIRHARWDGAMWVTTDIDDNGGAFTFNYPSIAIDSMDRPRVAYGQQPTQLLRYAAWDGAAWQIEDIANSLVVQYVDLALDAANNPRVAYRSSGSLRLASWNGTVWSIEDVDASGDWGRAVTLRIDSAGAPVVLAHANAQDIARLYSFDGGAWQFQDILAGAAINEGASFALDAADAAHISVGTKTPPVHLEYELLP